MLSGVALAQSELPVELMAENCLSRRVHARGAEAEVRFLLGDRDRVLPVWLDGLLRVARWGNRRGQSRGLPCTACPVRPGPGSRRSRPVSGPSAGPRPWSSRPLALDRGVWFQVREGIRGVAVRDEGSGPVAFALVEPASHYYRIMTRSEWMPVLCDQRI